MVDVALNCNKINEYLNSFLLHKDVQNTPSSSKKEITETLPSKFLSLPLTTRKQIQNRSHEKAKTLPTNYEDFKRRLLTFEFGLWTCTRISPLICASYGWRLSDKDILSCVTCNAMICTSLPLPNKLEAYANFSNKLKNRLKFGHKEWCGWPDKPSPAEFLHPPMYATVHYFRKLLEDANKLCTLKEALPYFDLKKFFRKIELDETQIAQFYGRQTTLDKIRITAAVLVLCGWAFDTCEKLRCNLCLRNIGLWNFLPVSKEEEFFKLKKRNDEKEAKKLRNKNRRKERERIALIKEEEKRLQLEAEQKIIEDQKKADEEALKVKLAIEKINRIGSGDTSELEGNDENEDLGEEEENSLLAEDNNEIEETAALEDDQVIAEEKIPVEVQESKTSSRTSSKSGRDSSSSSYSQISNSSKESSIHNQKDSPVQDQEESADNKETREEEGEIERQQESSQEDSDEDGFIIDTSQQESPDEESEEEGEIIETSHQESPQEDSDEDEVNDSSHHDEIFQENSEDEGTNPHHDEFDYEKEETRDSDDELWLEAVGGVNQRDEKIESSSSSYDDEKYRPESWSKQNRSNGNRKRRRSSESSYSDYEETNPASKFARREEDTISSVEEHNPDKEQVEDGKRIYRKRRRSSDTSDSEYEETERLSKYPRLEEELEELMNERRNATLEEENKDEGREEEISEDEEEEETTEEDSVYDKMKRSVFDPLEQHRHWCGWLVDHSSLYVEKTPNPILGFKILPRQLRNMLPEIPDADTVLFKKEKYASNIECFRTVRTMLDSWSIPEVSEEQESNDEDMEVN